MKYNKIHLLFSYLIIKITFASIVHPNEVVLRVRTPEEAHGQEHFVDFIGLAQQHGYEAKEYNVTTEDGYILQIFRIPMSPSTPNQEGKPVVLLQHGLFGTSDNWVFFNRSLAYLLADSGYDVWVGNARGNVYSHSHVSLSPDDSAFWNFTWNEIGKFDYASTIDYILEKTNKSSLTYIGHSMGGTAFVVLLSEKPEYNKKINIAILMAPSVFWIKENLLRKISLSVVCAFKSAIDPTGQSEFLPLSTVTKSLINFCQKNNLEQICFYLLGINLESDQVVKEEFELLLNYFPGGASTKSVWHYCQLNNNGDKFRKYDYGDKNIDYYGQRDPPDYKLDNIATNLNIFYTDHDLFCAKEDLEFFIKHISSKAKIIRIEHPTFAHYDFSTGKDVRKLVYDKLLQIISKYKN